MDKTRLEETKKGAEESHLQDVQERFQLKKNLEKLLGLKCEKTEEIWKGKEGSWHIIKLKRNK